VYSIFESHADLIKRGKARQPVEFGHKVFLAESAQGLITDYQVLDGNPADTTQVRPSQARHRQTFHCAPDLYAGDRGFYSAENLDECQKAGVSQVSIPQRGGQKTAEREALERSPAFKKGQRFRAGIEGRISVLFRGRGMKRCRAQGRERFEVLVGAAVLAKPGPGPRVPIQTGRRRLGRIYDLSHRCLPRRQPPLHRLSSPAPHERSVAAVSCSRRHRVRGRARHWLGKGASGPVEGVG